LPKGRVYTDTRLGLEGVALFGYSYEDVKESLLTDQSLKRKFAQGSGLYRYSLRS